MKRVLVLTSVASMIDQFLIPNIKLLREQGYSVDVACNFQKGNTCSAEKIVELKKTLRNMDVRYFHIDFARNILNIFENVKALRQVTYLLNKGSYLFIHCHSPIGGVIGRIAGKKSKTKVIYTAHGFHFYKGAPLKNWMLYYPVEKICSYFTDVLITINKEDYGLAQKKMKAKRIEYVPGVGIDLKKFGKVKVERNIKRQEFGISDSMKLLLSVGELNENKNHETVIRAIANLKNVYYIIAGRGCLQSHLEDVIKECKVEERVKLLGFRKDIIELCEAADAFVFPSFREGLSVSVMEAMASGLPVVCSRIRGNVDLVDENGGVLFNPTSINECQDAVQKLLALDMVKMGNYNLEKIKKFSVRIVNQRMNEIIHEAIPS